jgi:hypothetical protein
MPLRSGRFPENWSMSQHKADVIPKTNGHSDAAATGQQRKDLDLG